MSDTQEQQGLDIEAIGERAQEVPLIGYLASAFGGTFEGQALNISRLVKKDIPALIARVRELEEAAQNIVDWVSPGDGGYISTLDMAETIRTEFEGIGIKPSQPTTAQEAE